MPGNEKGFNELSCHLFSFAKVPRSWPCYIVIKMADTRCFTEQFYSGILFIAKLYGLRENQSSLGDIGQGFRASPDLKYP